MSEVCPICGIETAALYYHVFYDHLPPHGRHSHYTLCFCNEPITRDNVGLCWFAEHLHGVGGLERHMLECGLGVRDG